MSLLKSKLLLMQASTLQRLLEFFTSHLPYAPDFSALEVKRDLRQAADMEEKKFYDLLFEKMKKMKDKHGADHLVRTSAKHLRRGRGAGRVRVAERRSEGSAFETEGNVCLS